MTLTLQRSDLTAKARIRETALDFIGRNGETALSLRKVALEASVSPALIAHHFGSKAGLVKAVRDNAVKELFDTMRLVLRDPDTATVAGMITRLYAHLTGRPLVAMLIRRSFCDTPARGVHPFHDQLRTATAALLEELEGQGLAGSTDYPDQRAAIVASMLFGSMVFEASPLLGNAKQAALADLFGRALGSRSMTRFRR